MTGFDEDPPSAWACLCGCEPERHAGDDGVHPCDSCVCGGYYRARGRRKPMRRVSGKGSVLIDVLGMCEHLYVKSTLGPWVEVTRQALLDALAAHPCDGLPLYAQKGDDIYISKLGGSS